MKGNGEVFLLSSSFSHYYGNQSERRYSGKYSITLVDLQVSGWDAFAVLLSYPDFNFSSFLFGSGDTLLPRDMGGGEGGGGCCLPLRLTWKGKSDFKPKQEEEWRERRGEYRWDLDILVRCKHVPFCCLFVFSFRIISVRFFLFLKKHKKKKGTSASDQPNLPIFLDIRSAPPFLSLSFLLVLIQSLILL